MHRKTAAVIVHVLGDRLGKLSMVLNDLGFVVCYYTAGIDPLHTVFYADLLILMGGPISANDELLHPFLREELRLIEQRLKASRPVFGICLGAQLIAKAAGAKIYNNSVKEQGWAPLHMTFKGLDSCLTFLNDVNVFHWHSETFTLPHKAELLAFTDDCAIQAFQIDSFGLAVQFHIEIESKSLRSIVGLGPDQLLSDHLRQGMINWEQQFKNHALFCFKNWIESILLN